MKRILLIMGVACVFAFPSKGQTNFRPISYKEALIAAKSENKDVFIDFYTEWCGPCKMMARDVFPRQDIGEYMNSKFICIQLDAEKEGKELATLFQVKAYPTFIVTDINKQVIMKKEGGTSPDNFIAVMERGLNPEQSPERLVERYEKGERTPELIKAYASWILDEGKGKEAAYEKAAAIISDYFNGLSDDERFSPQNLFIYTERLESMQDPIAIYMVKHRNEFAPEIRDTIVSSIANLCKQEIFNYLCAGIPYNATEYQSVKETIKELGLNDTHCYDSAFALIECHARGNQDTFLTLCEELYDGLTPDVRFYLMAGFSRLINTDNKTIRQRAARFIRSKLSEMEVRLLFFIPPVLSELERESDT